jgi:hypothetical protein
MAIETTYRELIISDYLKDSLSRGVTVSASDVEDSLEELVEELDLSTPQFVASGHYVDRYGNSSASKANDTFNAMRQDLRVLYKEMLRLGKVSTETYERWAVESSAIEKQLVDLEDRIENLLLLTQDTEGNFAILVDNFTDVTQVDLDETDTRVDLKAGMVNMQPSSAGATRVFLNDLDAARDVSFKVRTTIDFLGRVDAEGSDLANVFHQSSQTWWTSVQMKRPRPVTAELTIRLSSTGPVNISRIFMELHDSGQSGPVQVTPLYSIDNINFSQLPTNTITQEVRSTASFSFREVEAQWVKFLITKQGPDPVSGQAAFSYQFGFKEISFYQEGFVKDEVQTLVTKPLWVADEDGTPLEFEKLTLDVCEREEEDTDIKYFITTSNVATVPVSSNTAWTPISPTSRAQPLYPHIVTVGATTENEYGDDETVRISYDSTAASGFVNPAVGFQLLEDDGSGDVQDTAVTATSRRYAFRNPADRILNYQIKDDVTIDWRSLQIFRNVGEQGLVKTDLSAQVRKTQRGWGFDDPWYSCVVEILDPEGIEVDFGDQPVVIDEIRYTGKVAENVLTGKSASATGIHRIKIHKNNWKHVTPGANTLDSLKALDSLYPYNHKLLIEGYSYGSSYPSASPQVYAGMSLFAEHLMQRVSIFDMLYNITPGSYKYFATDLDAPGTHTGGNDPTTVFVAKCDTENPDFQNERFVIRFNLVNQLRKYLRLRIDFSTEDPKVSPACYSYKIKLG